MKKGEELKAEVTDTLDVAYREQGKNKNAVSKIKNNREDIATVVNSNIRWYKQKMVKDDRELIERLGIFFDYCAENGELPTFEKMCLSLGAPTYVVKSWRTSSATTKLRKDALSQAVTLLSSIDAELVVNGAMPPIPYIFRAKNYYDMVDKQDFVFQAVDPLGDVQDKEELHKKYSESAAIDEQISADFLEIE